MECLKFDKDKVDFSKSAVWNVWKQFDIDIETVEETIKVENHFMPYIVQEELLEYLRSNYKKLKLYKRTKKNFNRSVPYEVLQYFPAGIKNDAVVKQLEKENENNNN